MLHAEKTMGAIIIGRPFECSTYEELEKLGREAEAIGAELFVGGDTSPGSGEESFIGVSVVGIPLATCSCDGVPSEITPAAIEAAFARAAELDWSALGEASRDTVMIARFPEIPDPKESDLVVETPDVGAYLICWGPLSFGALTVGARSASKPGRHGFQAPDAGLRYEFHAMQNMNQLLGAEGVDGVRITLVQFGDVNLVELDEAALTRYRAAASAHAEPKLFLIACYE